MKRRFLPVVLVAISSAAWAINPPDDPALKFVDHLPAYAPKEAVSGVIRLWGHGSPKHDFMGTLVNAWIEGFRKYQPDVSFENHMYGTASSVGALYTGAGDIALMGEEMSPTALQAFIREKHYAPTGVEIATGSLDVNYFDYCHMVFVQKDNPLTGITLQQLDGIYGAEHRRGSKNLRTWGDLGLTGEWATRPIHPSGWQTDVDFGLFFREAVLEGSHRWSPAVKEFNHVVRPDGTLYESGQQMVDLLAADPAGIVISNLRYKNAGVKALPVARAPGGAFYAATRENLISQKYPLTRIIPAYFDQPPGKPVEPKVREFIRYLLSREGQEALVHQSDYLPLGEGFVHEQLEKLR